MTKVLPTSTVARPSSEMNSSRVISGASTPMPVPASSGHLAADVRADLGKLEPSQRAEILRVANTK
jgi:hypothetical protein